MSDDFFKTIMGRHFYEGTMPRIADALEDIRDELKREPLDLESEEFYNLMQTYRHALVEEQVEVERAYEAVKAWIKDHL